MNITQVQKEDYLHHLIVNISKQDNYFQDIHGGAIFYSNSSNDEIYCTPAWEQWENPIEPFPIDNNVKIYIQFDDGVANTYYKELDYCLVWNIEKDLSNYLSIMADFLSNEENF